MIGFMLIGMVLLNLIPWKPNDIEMGGLLK
jgi:hypothetical protein